MLPGRKRRPPFPQDRDVAAVWDGVIRLKGEFLESLAARHGGRIEGERQRAPHRLVRVTEAGAGDLAPVLGMRGVKAGREAAARGASLLVEAAVVERLGPLPCAWVHEVAVWAMAELLTDAIVPDAEPVIGPGSMISASAHLGPRVVVGARVTIGAGAVVGHPGFGWATGRDGAVRAVPQLGGVIIEDDVAIGPLCTVDAGTLSPTRIRRGAKLDAHVHVGHNGDIGEGSIVAAQCGFAGSVTIGRGVRIGGQVGIADHVTVGDGARIAAKSGVIGDVPPSAVVAGYPAVSRTRWLRALAALYGGVRARTPTRKRGHDDSGPRGGS